MESERTGSVGEGVGGRGQMLDGASGGVKSLRKGRGTVTLGGWRAEWSSWRDVRASLDILQEVIKELGRG